MDEELLFRKICKREIILAEHCSYNIGGEANYFALPEKIDDLFFLIDYCYKYGLPFFIFGLGSNILFPDKVKKDYLFISIKKLIEIKNVNNRIFLSSGLPISFLSIIGLIYKKEELLFTYLLPGCIGGGIYMNAKYKQNQISDIIRNVYYIDIDGKKYNTIPVENCEFGYKNSIFQRKNYIIVGAEFKININLENYLIDKYKKLFDTKIDNLSNLKYFYSEISKEIRVLDDDNNSIIKNIEMDRVNKKQFEYPSCGSVFKNNYSIGIPMGKIIEDLGLKGFSYGGAMISPYHGNIIINIGNAKANDVLYLIYKIQEKVYDKYNFIPELEVIIIQ